MVPELMKISDLFSRHITGSIAYLLEICYITAIMHHPQEIYFSNT
jgi:hypothetical protein